MTLPAIETADRPDLDAYRAEVAAWLECNFPERWRPERDEYVQPDWDEHRLWERSLYEAGFAGLAWPDEFGGQGLTLIEQLVVAEELGRFGVPDSLNGTGKDMIGPILLAIGTEAQKRRFLPPILKMDEIWCQGFSEPEAGSDLVAIRTRARPEGRDWIVSGQKSWTSFATRAHWCLLLARTGEEGDRHAGLSLFAVPMDAPGITVRPVGQINGRANFADVFFDEVSVPGENILGRIGEGWIAASRVLEVERAINRMYRASLFENELRHLVSACLAETTLHPLLENDVYRHRIGGICADIATLRRLVRRTVRAIVDGEAIGATGSVIKYHWSETHQRLTSLAREMLAQAGHELSAGTLRAIERFDELYLRSRAETIQAGASAVQLDIIARRILRLPRA